MHYPSICDIIKLTYYGGCKTMIKFAVTLTKGDNRKILEICDTKDEAIAKGEKHRKSLTMDSGILSCISAEFDENNNRLNNTYKLIHSWI